MPQQIRAVVVDPSAPGSWRSSRSNLRDPDRDEVGGQGHRDLAQPRRDAARGAAGRAGLAARLGFRRRGRDRGRRRQRARTRHPCRRHPAVGRLGRAGQLPHPCGRRVCPMRSATPQAATLPVAGLTALHALRQGGLLLGRKVLVDGASGGVGHLACQLAAAAGALVWGHVRREEYRAAVAEWCGERVVLGRDLAAAKPHGPFWLILDSRRRPGARRGARHAAAERHLRDVRDLGFRAPRPSKAAISSRPAERGSMA